MPFYETEFEIDLTKRYWARYNGAGRVHLFWAQKSPHEAGLIAGGLCRLS